MPGVDDGHDDHGDSIAGLGSTITTERRALGGYSGLGAECGWYESDGEVHPDTPVADVLDRDYGNWILWATRDAMEGEHDELAGSDESALAQVIAAE
jgi:hypothetical protein